MRPHEAQFWRERKEYHDLAEQFERNVETVYPDRVSSRRMCSCLDWAHTCPFPLDGKAEYYEYRGERVT